MTWIDYVAFTATTALPAASNPEYLRTGLLEEAHEFLSAYCAMKAAELYLQRCMLHGVTEYCFSVYRANVDQRRQKAIEELGDVCWYTARAGHSTQPNPSRDGDPVCVLRGINMLQSTSAEELYLIGEHGAHIVEHGLSLLGVSLEDVLAVNVAE
jgi:hypothetical protein